jgi:hypothetical protein
LEDTGCYADFTLPSAPSDAQTRKINSIYYAQGNPEYPKCHDTGTDVQKGKPAAGGLMIIQGPLALNWEHRKFGILPRIENSEVAANNPPTEYRVDRWVKQHVCVVGEPNKIFVKVHTHGAQEKNFDVLLGGPTDEMFSYLESRYNDGRKYVLHYVTAWEMYKTIKTIEADSSQPVSADQTPVTDGISPLSAGRWG